MKKILFLTFVIITAGLVVSLIVISSLSFTKFIPANCDDQEIISQAYDRQITKNFLENHPNATFVNQGNRESFPLQCQYWFYDTDGTIQRNMWVVINQEDPLSDFDIMICMDHIDEQPLEFSPFKVPDYTSENC